MPKSKQIAIVSVLVMLAAAGFYFKGKPARQTASGTEDIHPLVGSIQVAVSTTGVVEPQNRLEIKPSISGRIEDILVREGDAVKKGDIVAWMSSTERAALVDAARFQGEGARDDWEEVYKKSPVVAPIDGQIIVRAVEPGQTVTSSDAILVISDRLIVSAEFDETDIGRVALGQKARITLDAYPEESIAGTVDHIAYESSVVNNVTIYYVDILPATVPPFFRSGMSANVDVIEDERDGVLTLPVDALSEDAQGNFVMVRESRGQPRKRYIHIGLKDDQNAEILSGLTAADTVVTASQTMALSKKKANGTSPFMPSRGKR